MYADILSPTDGSESSWAALEHALSFAEVCDARNHVLSVVNTTYTDIGATGQTTIDSPRASGEAVVREVEAPATTDAIDVITRIEGGDPYRKVLEYSDENIDLIVIGTRGRSGIDRYLLGSVTERVVRMADVPVVTVRGSGS